MAGDALQNFFLQRYADAYRAEMKHFVAVMRDGEVPAVGYSDGVAALVLAEAAALSVKCKTPIQVSSV